MKVWTDGCDWVVAHSAEDATRLMVELTGSYEGGDYAWRTFDDGQVLTVRNDDGDPPDSMTCAEWAARGRGHVASVNT